MKKANVLSSVKNSNGSQLWRNYFNKNGEDVLKNGDLSCAYYISSILLMHGLIDRVHFRVDGTIMAMEKSGWKKIKRLKIGAILIWNPVNQDGNNHQHIGVYIGDGQAISNRSSLGMPGEHPLHYSGLDKDGKKKKALIDSIYWHPDFDKIE